MSNAANFRKLLTSGMLVGAPGAIDCITGRAIAQAGFSAAYMTGAGTSATSCCGASSTGRNRLRRSAPK